MAKKIKPAFCCHCGNKLEPGVWKIQGREELSLCRLHCNGIDTDPYTYMPFYNVYMGMTLTDEERQHVRTTTVLFQIANDRTPYPVHGKKKR